MGWAQPATVYPNTVTQYAQAPIYGQPPVYGQPPFLGTLGALFGGINIGQVIDLVGQGFVALKALPAAPSSTGDVATDVANLTLYQRALAEHGRLDEQIRTGVHIVGLATPQAGRRCTLRPCSSWAGRSPYLGFLREVVKRVQLAAQEAA